MATVCKKIVTNASPQDVWAAIRDIGALHTRLVPGFADLGRPVYKAPPPMVAPIPVFSWAGCYIGANVGGAWAHQHADTVGPANEDEDQAPGFVTLKGSGVIGGPHAGCNFQFTPGWVVGIEGDWSATHLDDTASFPNEFLNGEPVGVGFINFSHDVKWLATIRGRLGYAVVPNALLYVTGGGAWSHTDYNGFDTFRECSSCGNTSFSSTKGGWVVGGGVEWAAWSNWLVRLEYLHYQFSAVSAVALLESAPLPRAAADFNFHNLDVDEVRVGLSYKFDWGPFIGKGKAPVAARY